MAGVKSIGLPSASTVDRCPRWLRVAWCRRAWFALRNPVVPEANIQLFARNDEVDRFEAQLAAAGQTRELELVLALAWHLRQRDSQRALALADEAQRLLLLSNRSEAECALTTGHLQFIRAEAAWLIGDLERAETLAAVAEAQYAAQNEQIGVGDVYWLRTALAFDRGDFRQSVSAADAAAAAYGKTEDTQRRRMAVARRVFYGAFIDAAGAQKMLDDSGIASRGDTDPSVTVWLASARGVLAFFGSNFAVSFRLWENAHAAALETGQVRQVIISVANICYVLMSLNNLALALEWAERGLTLARASNLPILTGHMLNKVGEVLHRLGRHASARTHLLDARSLLLPVKESQVFAVTAATLGEVSLSLDQNVEALDWLVQAEASSRARGEKDKLAIALRGRAQALMRLDRPAETLAVAHEALTLCRENGYRVTEIESLQIIADLYRRYALPIQDGLTPAAAPLHYLQLALTVAVGIEDYTIPSALLEEAAAEHAKLGNLAEAYRLALQAGQSRERMQSKEVSNRALAVELRYETERTRAEAEHHKQLARAEARRVELLQGAVGTLETLSEIGREITANLEVTSVFNALERHVHRLLDATHFAIYLMSRDGCTLQTALIVDAGKHLPVIRIKLDDPNSYVAHCARERNEVVLSRKPDVTAVNPARIPGTLEPLSVLFAPLVAGARLLGVMTMQSPHAHVYGERETAIFRALCAYGAIAIANGDAFDTAEKARQLAEEARRETAKALEELGRAQAQLLEQNKELELLSTTDRLTGLSNRLRLEVALEQEWARCERTQGCFSLILLDIDKFKSVNDTYGHQIGDAVLVELAKMLNDNIRKTDVVGRWGGEEFLIVCIDTTAEAATAIAEKIRTTMAAQDIAITGPQTGSFGVTGYCPGDNIKSMMRRADAALYRAKEAGRNRIELG